jgi:hypothetical protein
MSLSRRKALAYCGISTPVWAHSSRFTRLSALRARWAMTWPRVHPGSEEGSVTACSSRPRMVSSRRVVASATVSSSTGVCEAVVTVSTLARENPARRERRAGFVLGT